MKRLVRCASSNWVEPGRFDKTYLGVAVGGYHNTVAVIIARDESVAEQYFRRGAHLSSHWDSVYIYPFSEARYRNELNLTFSQSDQRRYTDDATARVAKACGYPVPPQYEDASHQKEAAKFWDAVYLKLTHAGGPLYVCYVDYDEDRRVNYWLSSSFVWPVARFVLQGSIEESDQYPREEIDTIRVDINSDTELPANIEDGMSLVIGMLQDELDARELPRIPTKSR